MGLKPLVAVGFLLAVSLAGCSGGGDDEPEASTSGSLSSSGTTTGLPNRAPTAQLNASVENGTAPLNVTFSLAGTDAEGDNLTWVLVFGDGNQTNGTSLPTTVNHTYAATGNHTASLTVSDGSLNRTATAKVAAEGEGAPSGPTPEDLCPTDSLAVGHETAGYYVTPADSASEPGSVWIYEESNGMPGLQRDDSTVDTECPTPDTIII
jgi:PKD repeat protein